MKEWKKELEKEDGKRKKPTRADGAYKFVKNSYQNLVIEVSFLNLNGINDLKLMSGRLDNVKANRIANLRKRQMMAAFL